MRGRGSGGKSEHEANERPISGGEPERARVPQPHGGVLTPFPPGVSGNPHRGPDRHPRVTQALILRALSESQVRVVDGKKVVVEMAASADLVRAIQGICERAAKKRPSGHDVIAAIRLLELTDRAFKNGNGHKNGREPMQPIAPNFIRPEQPPAAAESETPSKPSAPGTVIVGGEEYA